MQLFSKMKRREIEQLRAICGKTYTSTKFLIHENKKKPSERNRDIPDKIQQGLIGWICYTKSLAPSTHKRSHVNSSGTSLMYLERAEDATF